MTGADPQAEQTRRANNRQRVLDALRQAGPNGCTNVELVTIGGMRAVGGRLTELRADGYDIETVREGGGLFRFVLHEPARLQPGMPGYLASLPAVNSILKPVRPVLDVPPQVDRLF